MNYSCHIVKKTNYNKQPPCLNKFRPSLTGKQALVRDICGTHDSTDLFHGLKIGAQAAVAWQGLRRESRRAVLIGTDAFWEGVSVRGATRNLLQGHPPGCEFGAREPRFHRQGLDRVGRGPAT